MGATWVGDYGNSGCFVDNDLGDECDASIGGMRVKIGGFRE